MARRRRSSRFPGHVLELLENYERLKNNIGKPDLDRLPLISEYAENLEKAIRKFNISIDEAREEYGLFTIKE